MSDARKFRFVSPGIFINEVDQSQLPADAEAVGPVIIGRAEKGPGMIPVKVNSFSEFVETFGNPIDGKGGVDDVWRETNKSSPTYGAYAAQAYLRANVGPVTFVRLMGTQHDEADSDGQAGWKTATGPSVDITTNGGAYGLFVWPSGGVGTTSAGSLGAVFYMNSGVPVLSGTAPTSLSASTVGWGQTHEGTCIPIKDSGGNFKIRVLNSSGAEVKNTTVNLVETSSNFIRKALNTNPQLLNSTIEDSNVATSYFVGETFERYFADQTLTGTGKYGAILAIASASTLIHPGDKEMPYRDSHSGWFFGQSLSADKATYNYDDLQKLFKFVGINGHGEWLQNNIKISIENIKATSNENDPYGTFDVVLRKASDSDLAPVVIERFSACSLDPKSMEYIAVKVGDAYQSWDATENRYREFGNYPNRSRYIRVVMHSSFDSAPPTEALLPFGVYGPPRYKVFSFDSGSTTTEVYDSGSFAYSTGSVPKHGSISQYGAGGDLQSAAGKFMFAGGTGSATDATSDFGRVTITFPACGTRSTALADGADAISNAYFGLHTGKSSTSTVFDPGYGDYLKAMGADIVANNSWTDTFGLSNYGTGLETQWIFSLDEVIPTTGSNFAPGKPSTGITDATWTSGSYVAGTSWNSFDSLENGATRYQNILDSKINRFTSPMFGGFDGLDVTERDPFRNTVIGSSETGDYVYHTLRRAIDTVADPEMLSCNLMSVPGLTNESLTKYLIDTCEGRADALAIIDLKGGFQPRHETSDAISTRRGNLDTVLTNIKARNLNSSYGCAYYPWVTIRDDINSSFVRVPPSVVAMGVMANTEKKADVWFAPAGFNRGGLSQGAAGLPVLTVETKLTSGNRDDLYDVNINPIASFPAEGIVVFGQKTLQATRSALDRINVRRLLIYAKKGISQIASTTLFQPNVRDTWNAFKARAENFLGDVKVRYGIDEFKIVLDETTTTPDLVDRNIMYAKIFIKPTRAIEFIAIDFIITRSGASFED